MQTFRSPRFLSFLATAFALSVTPSAVADDVVKTLPGGDGKELLESVTDPHSNSGAIIRDEECAKKTGGGKLRNGKPNPEYERCVHEKIEKTRKKGNH